MCVVWQQPTTALDFFFPRSLQNLSTFTRPVLWKGSGIITMPGDIRIVVCFHILDVTKLMLADIAVQSNKKTVILIQETIFVRII